MKPAVQQSQISLSESQQTVLNRCMLVCDGNAHRADLCAAGLPATDGIAVSEALLPQIRTTAVMIAAMHHCFDGRSPDVFTEEADWFAARILVLGVRRFHLDVTLKPMLDAANRRAEAFALRHGLPFTPAEIRMSLHARRPANLLIVETALALPECGNMVADSLALARSIGNMAETVLR
ncbi:hypothetical protein [Neisseria sp.]|uniref:hypothetical protein n=1 Tax=Neisseria sp. TaxID=192066 RepID=UPI0035A0E790